MNRIGLILATFLGLAATAVPASADLQYTLNCGSAPCTVTGNYGTVTLHQDALNTTKVTVTVQLAAGEHFANTGAGYAIAWDITTPTSSPNADPSLTSVVINSALTPNSGNFAVQSFASGKSYKASPFTSGGNGDKFNYAIDYTGPNNGTDNKLVFDVTLSTGLAIENFVKNPNYRFAVDISGGPCSPTCNVASNGGGTKVPEPGTWTLSIAGLAGLTGLMMRQRRRKLARA